MFLLVQTLFGISNWRETPGIIKIKYTYNITQSVPW
jgi:hypothetical protein